MEFELNTEALKKIAEWIIEQDIQLLNELSKY